MPHAQVPDRYYAMAIEACVESAIVRNFDETHESVDLIDFKSFFANERTRRRTF